MYQYQDRLISPIPQPLKEAETPKLEHNIDKLLVELALGKPEQIQAARRNGTLVARMSKSATIGFSDVLGQRYLASGRNLHLPINFVIAGQAFLYAYNSEEGFSERKPLLGANLVTAMAEYAAKLQPEYRKTNPWISEIWGDYAEAHGFMNRFRELWYLRAFKEFYEVKKLDLTIPFEWDMQSPHGMYTGYCDKAIQLGNDVFGPVS